MSLSLHTIWRFTGMRDDTTGLGEQKSSWGCTRSVPLLHMTKSALVEVLFSYSAYEHICHLMPLYAALLFSRKI